MSIPKLLIDFQEYERLKNQEKELSDARNEIRQLKLKLSESEGEIKKHNDMGGQGSFSGAQLEETILKNENSPSNQRVQPLPDKVLSFPEPDHKEEKERRDSLKQKPNTAH